MMITPNSLWQRRTVLPKYVYDARTEQVSSPVYCNHIGPNAYDQTHDEFVSG